MLYLFIAILVLSVVLGLPKVKGFFGESTVKVFLSRLEKEKYTVINDILISMDNGRTSQIDHVVVSPFGIFVIETKNYKGKIYGNERSHSWTQVINRNKKSFYNPIRQNNTHIKALKALLRDLGEFPLISIVVFSGEASLKVQVTSEVTYFPNVNRVIKKYQQSVIPHEIVTKVIHRINTSNIEDKDARKSHVAVIRADITERERKISNGIIPRCGGDLVQKNGKYGKFVGCSSYPKCSFILKDAK